MVKQKNICVIGAGIAGLTTAKVFQARGHNVTILECSGDLGGVWEPARSYPEVQTQSPKDLYRYTDKPMPDSYPEWPNGPQVHAYLTDYAKDHGLMPRMRFNTTVVGMARRDSGLPGWTLKIQNPDSSTAQEDFDFVTVCTGQFNERRALSISGEDDFKTAGGEILHSAQHTDSVKTAWSPRDASRMESIVRSRSQRPASFRWWPMAGLGPSAARSNAMMAKQSS
jgi:dimethylaniline monooxygenase (N-oxide forming)